MSHNRSPGDTTRGYAHRNSYFESYDLSHRSSAQTQRGSGQGTAGFGQINLDWNELPLHLESGGQSEDRISQRANFLATV